LKRKAEKEDEDEHDEEEDFILKTAFCLLSTG
jgi:hypothetical protein